MKKILTLAIAISALFISCHKPTDGDLSGNQQIIGRLFLLDTLTQNANYIPQVKKKVVIRYASSTDTVNYLFSTYTDTSGYFTFNNLTKGTQYIVAYQELVNGIQYFAKASATAPSSITTLVSKISTSNQNGVVFTVKDYAGNILKGATICIFNSPTSAGYINGVCDGSSYSLTTDQYGHANVLNIPAGSYYVYSTATESLVPLSYKGAITISSSLTAAQVILSQPNGIHFITEDINSEIIGNVNLCVFTSNILFKNGGCNGCNFQLTSSASGTVDKYSLDKGTYYINAQLVIGADTLIGNSTIPVSDTITNCIIKLDKKH